MNAYTHRMTTKIPVSAAIALGSLVVGAAPASADANSSGTDANPFGALGSPALTEEMKRGICAGLSAGPGK